jgi:phosphoribosylglycinamide formyltransferase-1
MKLRLAVLVSGGGKTLQNLLTRNAEGGFPAEVAVVVSSKPSAPALERARIANVLSTTIAPYPTKVASEAIFSLCREQRIDLVVLAGYMHFLPLPADYVGKAINIHPSLIPAFCGKGCYGLKVHEAALARGVKVSGCTVHFVDNEYDHGPIILQRTVPVLDDDSPETLAARVFEAECEAYPEAIRLIAEKRVAVEGGRVRVDGRAAR